MEETAERIWVVTVMCSSIGWEGMTQTTIFTLIISQSSLIVRWKESQTRMAHLTDDSLPSEFDVIVDGTGIYIYL